MSEIKYFTQIPAWVDELDNVSDFQVRLLGFIYTLENTTGTAFPSNKTLAAKYRKSIGTVKNALSDLYDKGYLKFKKIYKKDSKEVERRFLYVVTPELRGSHENHTEVVTPELRGSHSKVTDSKSFIKSTSKSVNRDILSGSGEPDHTPYSEIIDYLNDKSDKKFKHKSSKTRKLIKARYSDGFGLDDFKRVIDNKVSEWKGSPDMNQYLRPETLFGTKFESYLNQKMSSNQEKQSDLDRLAAQYGDW